MPPTDTAALGWDSAEREQLARLLIEQTHEYGVVRVDTQGRIIGWSRGAWELTGFTPEDVLGEPVAMLYSEEDRERGMHLHELRAAEQMGIAEDERWHVRKNGSRLWCSGLCVPLRADEGQLLGFVKIFRDATHLRLRTRYLENEVQRMSRNEEDRHVLLGTTAHELRNPLAPLNTALQLLKKEQPASPKVDHALRVMERQLGFMERLVEDLVDVTRMHTGKMSVSFEPVQVQQLLETAAEVSRPFAQAKGVELQMVLPPAPLQVELDAARFQQVVVNLLNNAVKFTPTGGQVWLAASADQTHFIVSVKDTGEGISPELLPRIFDMFTQARETEAARGAGLGIGLSVVKELVALHQGTVEVRSDGPGKGSDFSVHIPLRQPTGPQAQPMLPH